MRKKQNVVLSNEEKGLEKQEEMELKDNYKKVILSFIYLIVYAAMLKPLGFVISSICYLFFQINIMTEKPDKKQEIVFIVLAVCVPVIVNLIFVNVFSMALPQGILGIGG